jgi:ParB family chromosome partitioning protein
MDEGALFELAESIKSQGIMHAGPGSARQRRRALLRRRCCGPSTALRSDRRRAPRSRGPPGGLTEVPVLVRDVPDEAAAAMALIENIQREDLNPLEEAQGLKRLTDEFGLTHEEAARSVGRSRSARAICCGC